jgi:hypothetical protein
MPDPWIFVLLALAAWRTWKLIGDDSILEGWRMRNFGPESGEWGTSEWRDFLGCPYCSGLWIAFGWWAAWIVLPTPVEYASVPMALSAVVGLIGTAWNALLD